MGIQYEGDSSEETLRLVRENNRMLKNMRRSSLIGSIVKTIIWAALVFIPIWFYLEYVAPVMQGLLSAYEQAQSTNAAAQAQLGALTEPFERFKAMFGGQE